FSITKFNLKTPGRIEENAKEVNDSSTDNYDGNQIVGIINGLGGKDNINGVNACYSRLRVDVENPNIVDKEVFANKLEASGVSILGKNVQVIYGNKAANIKESVLAELKNERCDE